MDRDDLDLDDDEDYDDDDDDGFSDDTSMVMSLKNVMDCIGCQACSQGLSEEVPESRAGADSGLIRDRPGDGRLFVEAVNAWGRDTEIRVEARLMPLIS